MSNGSLVGNSERIIMHDWQITKIIDRLTSIKRLTQRECRKAFNNYISSFIDAENNCTKKLCFFIKSRRLDQTSIGPINYRGETHTDYYPKLMHSLITFHQFMLKMIHLTFPLLKMNRFLISNKSTLGVTQLLLNLKPYKAVGPDNLPSYFLKEVANEIAPSLCLIFQASLN